MPPDNHSPHQSSSKKHHSSARKIGTGMMATAWIIGLLLLATAFGLWEEVKLNPNRNPEAHTNAQGERSVKLKRNRYGHYVTSGTINGRSVTFMVDTGATTVSIPANVANEIGLKRGATNSAITANGTIDVYSTQLDTLTIGNIVLRDVVADINTHISGEGILLGMSVLKYLDFAQAGDTLTLHQY